MSEPSYLGMIKTIRLKLHEKIKVKTGWGCNEVLKLLDEALLEASGEQLDMFRESLFRDHCS